MAESIETSDKANKSFYSNVFVLLFIVKLHIKKFKQFCLSDLLIKNLFKNLLKMIKIRVHESKEEVFFSSA